MSSTWRAATTVGSVGTSSRENLVPSDGNSLEGVFVADTPPLEDG